MKKLELEPFSLRLRTPVRAAWGTLERRELLRVRLRDTGNDFGVGEAAPLEDYDGVSLAAVRAELERGEPSLPHAVAAVNMAEWDLRGRRDARPVAALLVEDPLGSVPVNALVGAEDRETASAQAAQAVAAGFRCLKVKVGVGDDAGRLAAVRAAVGPDVALRIDANGAWTVDEAVAALQSLASVGIELCEEPVHGVEALAAVRAAVEVPVAMDETALEPGAVESGAADAVCLRVGAHGGISRVLEAAAAARGAGSDVYLASTFDGPVGVAAGLHAAAALRVTRPCGLATLALFDGLTDPFPPVDGAITLPDTPGLGVS
jgi:L-alanine-DL-glutamate epimerase-like enolase superfamily enzyme